jgi:small GTP-binding protein
LIQTPTTPPPPSSVSSWVVYYPSRQERREPEQDSLREEDEEQEEQRPKKHTNTRRSIMVRFGSNGSRSISLQIHEEDEEEIDSGVIPDDHSFASADAFVMASTLQQGKARSRLSSRCESTDSSKSGSNNSGSGGGCGELPAGKSNYRILVLGTCGVGKTSIIRQFLYDKFSPAYRATAVEDMYRGEFDIYGQKVGFDIQDVSGNYVYEFPGMRNVSLASADAFIIVFALDDANSWEEVARLRDMVHEAKKSRDGEQVPIVVVGNKCEVEAGHDPCILKDSPEAICGVLGQGEAQHQQDLQGAADPSQGKVRLHGAAAGHGFSACQHFVEPESASTDAQETVVAQRGHDAEAVAAVRSGQRGSHAAAVGLCGWARRGATLLACAPQSDRVDDEQIQVADDGGGSWSGLWLW